MSVTTSAEPDVASVAELEPTVEATQLRTGTSALSGPPPSRGWRRHVPRIFATVLTIVAIICTLAAINTAFRHGVQPVRRLIDELFVPAPANLAYALFVAILAGAVARRKRVAYWILVGYFGLQFLAGVGLGLLLVAEEFLMDQSERATSTETWWWVSVCINLAITIIALAVLLVSRRQFYARTQRGNIRKAIGVFLGLMVLFAALGYGLVELFPGGLRDSGDRLQYTIEKILGGAFTFQRHFPGRPPGWVTFILGLLGAIALFAAVLTLLRSQRSSAVLAPAEEQRIRELLAESGERDSLGYFATRRDKAAVFSSTGKAAVTYRVVASVSLASGDPIGEPEAWQPAIESWLTEARAYAWTPAVMGASEEGAKAYARAGLKVIQLGDEAIIEVKEFTLEGREMRPVRQAVNRIERAGYTARVRRHADVPAEEMAQVAELATHWRDTESERGFSMALGRLGDPADDRCVLVEAFDSSGKPAALLSFSPWGTHGLSLDLMRRDPESDNGVMELMVVSLIRQCPFLKVDRISLNFAVFRSVFEDGARIGAGPVLRAWRRLLLFFSHWWQLESLYRSNVKYQPHWAPRYLCFAERRELAKVGLASAIAEGFLAIPGAPAAPLAVSSSDIRPAVLSSTAVALPAAPVEEDGLPEQMRVRMDKLEAIRASGVDPYPVSYPRSDSCGSIVERFGDLAPDSHTGVSASIAGRVVLLRNHGKLCFATLRDFTGDLQVMISYDGVGQSELDRWKSTVDLGDHIGVSGEVITSRRGELSVQAASWALTAKCLRPLPDKRLGLADPEAKVRQRYLDLVTSADAREVLRARSKAVHSIRESLVGRGFLEVETPMLQRIHGGANARPFTTHINAYDMRLYLRIAPELYLKRLAVGGVEKVFELGRTFRNEGVSFKHNPEFSMLEAYQAYADYEDMLVLTRDIIQQAATAAFGSPIARKADENGRIVEYDISGEWPAMTVNDAISQALGEEITADTELPELQRHCDAASIPYDPKWGRGAVVLEMYERLVEHHTTLPTFYKDFPTDVSPLTRQHRIDPRLAERWDLVAFGTELGTAYSELVDPVEQRRRLTEQSLLAAGGDPEAMELDEDFLTALEYAMPPSGGLGIGVDRLVMLLTGRSIRETLPFPLVRPSNG